MTRRAAVLAVIALGTALAAGLHPAPAQQPGKVFRIGILSPAERPDTKIFDAFREGLRVLGYVDGKNIMIEYRLAAGDTSQLPAMADELVRLPVDVIVTDGQKSVVIAQETTRSIPIVGALGPDPVAVGLVRSFAHPGGNVTGFAGLGVELSGKRLQLLKEAFPGISRIAALWNSADANILALRGTEEAARTLGVQLRRIDINTPDEIPAGFEMATARGAEGLVTLPDAMFWNQRVRIVTLAVKYRMPAIYPEREYVDDGGLLAYGQDMPDSFRRAAAYVDKILKGAEPADLPIERPTKFELVINLKTAQALRLTIPRSMLALADEVIE
jgi:putative tryptophan/tyrosine transport system substrate-binding protein